MPKTSALPLTPAERRELEARLRSRSLRSDDSKRARLLLLLADGESYDAIQESLDCGRAFVALWKGRFLKEGLAGLYSRHKGRAPRVLTPRTEARILEWTRRKPTAGPTQWSTRRLARGLMAGHWWWA